MGFFDVGAWFSTRRDLDWEAARQAIQRIDIHAFWDHPASENFVNWESLADYVPEAEQLNPEAYVAHVQDSIDEHVSILAAAVADPVAIERPVGLGPHAAEGLASAYDYGDALAELAGKAWADTLGVVVEDGLSIYFTVTAAPGVDVDEWYVYWAIWKLGPSGILEAAGAEAWIEPHGGSIPAPRIA